MSFSTFDLDADPRWQEYVQRIEVPDPAALQRLRKRWYKKNIDPDFDMNSSMPGQNATPGAAAECERPSTPAPNADGAASASRPQQSADTPQQPGPSGFRFGGGCALLSKMRAAVMSGSEQQLFVMHLLLIAAFVCYLQPLNRGISRFAYYQFLLLGAASHVFKVFKRFGLPSLRPFPHALRPWLAQAAATTDLQYAIICSAFLNQRPILLVTLPVLVLAIYHASAYASVLLAGTSLWTSYGSRIHALLLAKQRDAQTFNAGSEIALGFLLLVSLLTPNRAILQTLLYWQILRTRFHTPDCSAYHHMVWRMIDQRTISIRQRLPVLQMPIGLVQRWFCSMR